MADPLASHKTGSGYRNDADTAANHVVSYALKRGKRDDGESETFIVGPLGGGNSGAGRRTEDDPNLVAYALRKDPGGTGQGHNTNYATAGVSVRRLTPTECERLQALPDGWTRLDESTPDSRRYAALGDAVTATVAEWIGRRLLAAS